jgi:hypothetical protein
LRAEQFRPFFLSAREPYWLQTRQGSEPAGILAGMDAPGRRYRDREDSRFYQARGLSPEETWHALGDELARVLDDAQRAFWCTPFRMDRERVRWWHGAIFARRFPHDGGRFRRDLAFFGVVLPDGGMRQLKGVAPAAIRRGLATVCAAFNRRVEDFRAWNPSSTTHGPRRLCTQASCACIPSWTATTVWASSRYPRRCGPSACRWWSCGSPPERSRASQMPMSKRVSHGPL